MKVNHFLFTFLFSNKFFPTFNFLTNSNRFGLDHTKYLTGYLTLLMNFFHKMALHYTFIKTTQSLITQNNHFCTHICVISCASQTQPNLTFQNQLNMQTVTPPFLIPMNLYLTKIHHKNLLFHQLHLITILKLLPQMTAQLSISMTPHFSKIFKTHQTDIPSDRLRHPSQNQFIIPPPPIDRTTKTHYNLRHQRKRDYRLLYHRQNSKTNHSQH